MYQRIGAAFLCATVFTLFANRASAGGNYSVAEAALTNDPGFSACQVRHVPADAQPTVEDVLAEFECAYKANDFRAAEVLGEALASSGVKLAQRNTYWLANAYYKRGNGAKALQYVRLAYSHLTSKDKAIAKTTLIVVRTCARC